MRPHEAVEAVALITAAFPRHLTDAEAAYWSRTLRDSGWTLAEVAVAVRQLHTTRTRQGQLQYAELGEMLHAVRARQASQSRRIEAPRTPAGLRAIHASVAREMVCDSSLRGAPLEMHEREFKRRVQERLERPQDGPRQAERERPAPEGRWDETARRAGFSTATGGVG